MFYEHIQNEKDLSGNLEKGDYLAECYRTVCTSRPADFFNHSTKKYYCGSCAHLINEANYSDAMKKYGHDLCTRLKVEI